MSQECILYIHPVQKWPNQSPFKQVQMGNLNLVLYLLRFYLTRSYLEKSEMLSGLGNRFCYIEIFLQRDLICIFILFCIGKETFLV